MFLKPRSEAVLLYTIFLTRETDLLLTHGNPGLCQTHAKLTNGYHARIKLNSLVEIAYAPHQLRSPKRAANITVSSPIERGVCTWQEVSPFHKGPSVSKSLPGTHWSASAVLPC